MENELINKLLEKSEEAFLLAIEIYNKPTIKYRVEGFAFFICNAWELMLKAYLLKQQQTIYYKDKPDRTISLSECIKKIFTNNKDPLRLNLVYVTYSEWYSYNEYLYENLFNLVSNKTIVKEKEILTYSKGFVRLTEFGKNFIDICLS